MKRLTTREQATQDEIDQAYADKGKSAERFSSGGN